MKKLSITLGILVTLLIAAVILLSMIVLSLTKETNDTQDTLTTPAATLSTSQTTDSLATSTQTPVTESKPVTTASDPTQTGTPVQTDPIIVAPATTGAVTTIPTDTVTTGSVTTVSPIGGGVSESVVTTVNPDGSISRSGSLIGEHTVSLYLVLTWEAIYPSADSSDCTLNVTLYLSSYSLGLAARTGNSLWIADNLTTFDTPVLQIQSGQQVLTSLVSVSRKISKGDNELISLPLSALWYFGGTYSGVSLDQLTLSGNIEV
jgi:hypothetical protein